MDQGEQADGPDELDEHDLVELGAVTPDGVEYRVVVARRGVAFRAAPNQLAYLLLAAVRSIVAARLNARAPIRKVGVLEVRWDEPRRLVHQTWAPSLDEALVLAVEICDEVAAGELRWVDPSA